MTSRWAPPSADTCDMRYPVLSTEERLVVRQASSPEDKARLKSCKITCSHRDKVTVTDAYLVRDESKGVMVYYPPLGVISTTTFEDQVAHNLTHNPRKSIFLAEHEVKSAFSVCVLAIRYRY
eukprot:1358220-Rhodomonas_salina.1